MTTIDEFRSSTTKATPPGDIGPALEALWWAHKGDWDRAHQCVQGHEGQPDCDWVHAHLHHQEGDMTNAGGWYRRAGRKAPPCSVQEEWTQVVTELLARKR